MNDLPEEERRKVAAQVEYFIELVGRRYDVRPDEVIEAVKWVRERRELAGKMKQTGIMSIIGLILSAVSMAVWEGVKAMLAGGGR